MAEEKYLWQKARLKRDRLPGASLISGFGPNGEYSLYLPSPRVTRNISFSGGKPQVTISGDLLQFPDIVAARERVLKSGRAEPGRIIFADASLAEYSALILATQYDFKDADLDMLHSGSKWHEPIIVHALGGVDSINALAKIDTTAIRTNEMATDSMITNMLIDANTPPPQAIEVSPESVGIVESPDDDDMLASD